MLKNKIYPKITTSTHKLTSTVYYVVWKYRYTAFAVLRVLYYLIKNRNIYTCYTVSTASRHQYNTEVTRRIPVTSHK